MGIYLFRKYWSKHKVRLFSLILSIILLVAASVFSVLNERAEQRRKLHGFYDRQGNYSATVRNVTDEREIKEITEIPEIDRIGIVSVAGNFKEGDTTYTVGCLENGEAENSMHFPMTDGRMPGEAGEIAMPEFLINLLCPNASVGDEISFGFDAHDGESTEGTYRLSGIINNYTYRQDMEYQSTDGVIVVRNDWCDYPTPSVYIHKDSLSGLEKYYNYYLSLDEESLFYREKLDSLQEKLWDISKRYGSVSNGGDNFLIMEFMSGYDEAEGTVKTGESDNIKMTRLISVFMVIVAGISMFSGILSVMQKRSESLRLLRFIGMSRLKLLGIFITEFFLFWLIGSISGILAGCAVHELVLILQKAADLKAYHGYAAELVVERLTMSPFVMPLILSLVIAAVSLIIPVKRILQLSANKKSLKKRASGGAGSFGRAFSKVTGARFTLLLSFFSLSVVVCISLFVYCYYTESGKGTTYFSGREGSANYYKSNGIDFKESGTDCNIYVRRRMGDFRVWDGGYGVTAGELKELKSRADCIAWGSYPAMICYDKDEEYPAQLELLYIDPSLRQDVKSYAGFFIDYYNLINNIKFELVSAELMERLYGAGEDDVVLVWDNNNFPYEVGESVNVINFLCDSDNWLKLESMRRIGVKISKQFNTADDEFDGEGIPEGVTGSRKIVMTAETARELGFYYPEYSEVAMTFREKMNDRQIRDFVSRTVNRPVNVITIGELERKARIKRLSSNANSIMLFILLFILNTVSLWNLLRVNAGNNEWKFYVMHSIGLPWKRIRMMFIRNILAASAVSLVLCSLLSLGAQRLMSARYDEFYSLLARQHEILGYTEFPEIISRFYLHNITDEYPDLLPVYDITARMEKIEKAYMLKKEMWLPNLTVPLLIIWAAVIVSTLFCALAAAVQIREGNVRTDE